MYRPRQGKKKSKKRGRVGKKKRYKKKFAQRAKTQLSHTRFELVTLCVLSTRDNQLHQRDRVHKIEKFMIYIPLPKFSMTKV
jgi:hypothetical protein